MKYLIYINSEDNVDYAERVYRELKSIPDWLVKDFYDYGGEIIVGKILLKGYENKAGVFLVRSKDGVLREGTARIYLNEDSQKLHTVIQGMGHYFYHKYHIFDNKFTFDKDEMIRFVNEFCNGSSFYLERKEFFAEAFSTYFQGKLTKQGYPVTVSQLSELWEG